MRFFFLTLTAYNCNTAEGHDPRKYSFCTIVNIQMPMMIIIIRRYSHILSE